MKAKCPEFENHERWLVSYADMLTLLFAVFVVLFALKEGGEPQVQKAAGAMQESFNTPLEDIPIDRRLGPLESGFGIFDHLKGNSIRQPISKKFPSHAASNNIFLEEMVQFKVSLEERLYGPNKFREAKKTGFARIMDVEKTQDGFQIRLLGRHFYPKGSVHMTPKGLKAIDQLAIELKELGRKITIEGHTDSLKPRGKWDNWELSTLRATNVLKHFINKHSFPHSLLGAVGYAATRPIAHNGTEAGRKLNRRIEIHVHVEN